MGLEAATSEPDTVARVVEVAANEGMLSRFSYIDTLVSTKDKTKNIVAEKYSLSSSAVAVEAQNAAREALRKNNERLLHDKRNSLYDQLLMNSVDWTQWVEIEEEALSENNGQPYQSHQLMLIAKFPTVVRELNKSKFGRMIELALSPTGIFLVCNVTESQAAFLTGIFQKKTRWIVHEEPFSVVSSPYVS